MVALHLNIQIIKGEKGEGEMLHDAFHERGQGDWITYEDIEEVFGRELGMNRSCTSIGFANGT